MRQEKGPMWKLDDNDVVSVNGNKEIKPAPTVKDIIGRSLPHIGTYKSLDNKKQAVALIDDVSIFVKVAYRYFGK